LTKSQQVLISLLKKGLFNFEAEIPTDVDWQEVYDEANFQSVIPFVYDATAGIENIPADILKKLKAHTIAIMFNNDKVTKVQTSVCKLLEDNKINYCILKGLSVARYYNKPELRTLGDVDILVSKDAFDYVKSFLSQNGYVLTDDEKNHFHCAFKKDEVRIELHFEMSDFPNTSVCDELRKELDKAMEYVEKAECMGLQFYSLDVLYQACSLLLHTERHISKDGIGLRQLIDFGMFIKENPEFLSDEENVAFLKKFGLYKLTIICSDLFEKYFCNSEIDNKVAEKLLEMSLKKGTFGSKQEKEESYSNGSVRVNSKNKFFAFFEFTQNRALLTWSLAKKYQFLKYLGFIYLPIRHIFRTVFKKQKVDYKKVLKSNNEVYSLYNDLSIFKR